MTRLSPGKGPPGNCATCPCFKSPRSMPWNPSCVINSTTCRLASTCSPEMNSTRLPPSAFGLASKFGFRWLNALTTRAPGSICATTSVEGLPPRSKGLNSGASMGLLVSTTTRPSHGPRPTSADEIFDQFTARKTTSAKAACAVVTARALGPSSAISDVRLSGPRLLARSTSRPASVSNLAIALPMAPAPMMPILMIGSSGSEAAIDHRLDTRDETGLGAGQREEELRESWGEPQVVIGEAMKRFSFSIK
ncbi:hypothetical protein EMIT0373P_10563 [Pseudomonas chlororaphis]